MLLFRETVMPWITPLIILLTFVFFIPIQTHLFEGIKVFGVKPDLGFVLSYLAGLTWGGQRGLFLGLVLGGLQDFFSVGNFGPNFFLKGLIGFSAGLSETFFIYFALPTHFVVSFFVSLLHDLIGTLFLYGILDGLMVLSWSMIGRALYNSVITTGVLFFLSRRLQSGDLWINGVSK